LCPCVEEVKITAKFCHPKLPKLGFNETGRVEGFFVF